MKTRFAPTALVLSLLAALSASALAFGHGDKMPRADHKAFHEAVMSGALTDAELATLKKERDTTMATIKKLRDDGNFSSADREQAKKLHQALQDKTKALIDNADRTQKRDKLPPELAQMHMKGGMHDGMCDGKPGHEQRKGAHGMPHEDMKQFRDAVISGALTDAELATLKQERSKLMDSARQNKQRPDMTQLHALTKTLISNQDRGPARTSWTDDLAPWAGGRGH
ncbi:hypothetical protein PQU95_00535 [Vogesella sp. DC21W]|uniref:LTXXQ motif family protein n=1 Tax=Vogesella aquatica TaxID=2984206 RepID=A0ABT5IT10_9NEIS|nr:hypothetical protein [Vogesella aquatica]MDC7715705.1 hypothetical protein [Vogesella aquatica]